MIDGHDLDELCRAASQAARSAIIDTAREHLQRERDEKAANDKARARKSKAGWTDDYTVRVRRYPSVYGPCADISLVGGHFPYYRIYQDARTSKLPRSEHRWNVQVHTFDETRTFPHRDSMVWDLTGNDFEAIIKSCIRLLLNEQGLDL